MGSGIVEVAVNVAHDAGASTRLHPFEEAAGNFARLLGGVPDCAAGELGNREIARLFELGSEVIDVIEQRLDEGSVPESHAVLLVGLVYRIRRHLEEIEIWRRHYAVRRP